MAYIRIKKINGQEYAYLVQSITTKKGPRQKVKQYLGRVFNFEDIKDNNEFKEDNIVKKLIISVLYRKGFKTKKKNLWIKDKIIFDGETLTKNKKNIVIKSDDGYLCNYSISQIKKFQKSDDVKKDGQVLAKLFLDAGLPIEEEDFISFYQSL